MYGKNNEGKNYMICITFYHTKGILEKNFVFFLILQFSFFSRTIVEELVDTEEEFGRDLQNVVNRYIKTIHNPFVPKIVRDNKNKIFTNFQQISEFHNT